MGLSVEVLELEELATDDEEGAAWHRQALATADRVLHDSGLPPLPASPSPMPAAYGSACCSFPYSFLHFLRRVYAMVDLGLQPTPTDELSDEDNERMFDVSSSMTSHLLCHSDCEGYYVPVPFDEPLFDEALVGGMLGSSQSLLRELRCVAPVLGITMTAEGLSDDEAARLDAVQDGDDWFREIIVWHALWQAATTSVATGRPLLFT